VIIGYTGNPIAQWSWFMEEYRLELRNVSKSFGEVQALENINFCLGRNEIVGLLGIMAPENPP
jgi:ABC-type polysaccharide/polyol phosphate transport system ATPase subunit